ncbi:electron transport complex subunit RsxB [Shewanella sp. 1_MG-2023]|uniref:Ion-translocating oxidoreductase complex subunit B n=1 Tax=Shewanella electrodiphila TaxID=934143 RepID=A0ABT0KML8_9GAMM|nr:MULTISPECIES: electron transport complex subunit RsxB [Shewanella]MCL1045100.1 electron transport complex subunit RsxB [Shewanella electrodiphila]MDO6613337.1 electron transport complex subunit RsxB [Shewanella sp. 7_MG-2023]MDO6773145.1 electron transport complex subunit RsxB [Shewanella sp. 2_MG-2023]MDO6795347.1 electron transport complex subunit RsxB [Shewanella sp. 1_MG-2023]PMG81045.1 electron transport complex subunit RsxB [Shewanella sp. 10N.286.51.B7]
MSSIAIAVVVLTLLALIFGLILGYASIKFKVEGNPIIDQVEALLPQTQCGQCGYPGCRPYAEAIANGDNINKCPPGGTATMEKLAGLMGVDPEPLNEVAQEAVKKVAYIREDECIGCTKCIQACPVDAILGAGKLMHTVIAKDCTGCDLCVEPCPVDCIDMIPVEQNLKNWDWKLASIPVTVVEDRTVTIRMKQEDKAVKEDSQC